MYQVIIFFRNKAAKFVQTPISKFRLWALQSEKWWNFQISRKTSICVSL